MHPPRAAHAWGRQTPTHATNSVEHINLRLLQWLAPYQLGSNILTSSAQTFIDLPHKCRFKPSSRVKNMIKLGQLNLVSIGPGLSEPVRVDWLGPLRIIYLISIASVGLSM